MTPDQLRRIRKELGLTQVQLAALLGVQALAVIRWEGGTRGISEPVARLIMRIRAEAKTKQKRNK